MRMSVAWERRSGSGRLRLRLVKRFVGTEVEFEGEVECGSR